MKKKVFNAVEVMKFGRILDARFTAKYSVQDLFNYANKLRRFPVKKLIEY